MQDYHRIASAIAFIREQSIQQPSLEEIAAHVNLSPFHFQRIFKEWAGVSPKKFLQYISVQHARNLLENKYSVQDTTLETGLSGPGRLHDLFVSVEAMTPGEYKNGGELLTITYSFADTIFGKIMIAATERGICRIEFADDEKIAIAKLKGCWPAARLNHGSGKFHEEVICFFNQDWNNLAKIKLHLKASPFQLKVWEALLKIPSGRLHTYAAVASSVDTVGVRAVGTAIGNNPVAYLIPCHRVIRSSGIIGDYRWGNIRKTSMIGWEQSRMFAGNVE